LPLKKLILRTNNLAGICTASCTFNRPKNVMGRKKISSLQNVHHVKIQGDIASNE